MKTLSNVISEQIKIAKAVKSLFNDYDWKMYASINHGYTVKDLLIIYGIIILNILIISILESLNFNYLIIYTPFAIFLQGVVYNWINVQVHEASHYLLFKNKKINDKYCDLFLSGLIGYTVKGYRTSHSAHHSKLHSNDDPDLDLYKNDIQKYSKFRIIMSDLLGITFYKKLLQKKELSEEVNTSIIVTQIISLLVFILIFEYRGPLFYIVFMILPLVTIYPFIIRVRTVIQHSNYKSKHRIWISRSTNSNLLEHIIFGARMDWHFEHHLFPNIPYYNLKKINREILKSEFEKKNLDLFTSKYFKEFKTNF